MPLSDIMSILYSIPVKVVSTNGTLKCTIPKDIVNKTGIKKGDRIIWKYYDNGKIIITPEKKDLNNPQ